MTMPSAVFLMASAGQTSAQVGDSQCMQTTGMVCTECARSAVSRWIIEWPLWVSHSLHAWTHDWQPMQRLWSRYMVRVSATGIVGFLCRLRPGGPLQSRTAKPQAAKQSLLRFAFRGVLGRGGG